MNPFLEWIVLVHTRFLILVPEKLIQSQLEKKKRSLYFIYKLPLIISKSY